MPRIKNKKMRNEGKKLNSALKNRSDAVEKMILAEVMKKKKKKKQMI